MADDLATPYSPDERTDGYLSARQAAALFALGAWALAVAALTWAYVTGQRVFGTENAPWWKEAIVAVVAVLAALAVATVCGTVYAIWLRVRRFSTRWRRACLVPVAAGVASIYLFGTLYAAILPMFRWLPEPLSSFLVAYGYFFLAPVTLVMLAEASVRLLRSIDADILAA